MNVLHIVNNKFFDLSLTNEDGDKGLWVDSFFIVYCEDFDLEVMARQVSDKKTLIKIDRNIEPNTLQVYDVFFQRGDEEHPDVGTYWMAMIQDQKFIVDKFTNIDQFIMQSGKEARQEA